MRPLLGLLLIALVPSAGARERATHAPAVEGRPQVDAHIDWQSAPAPDEVPISLTASDGTGLVLRSMAVRSAVQDPLALTELHLVFVNPEERVREGRFEIALPPGAAVSRFAMMIDGRWQEGEVVEKQAARRAYEDFLHRRQDPALLEMDAGNRFRARVFPIPAEGEKEIVLSYSQELRGSDEPYRVMIAGLPELERFDATLVVDTWGRRPAERVLEVHETAFSPRRDLALAFEEGARPAGLRAGEYGVARVTPLLETTEDPVRELTVLLDTSASRALGFSATLHRLDAVLEAMGDDFPLQVLAFDQGVELVYSGPARGFGPAEVAMIERRGALGASDLEGALEVLPGLSPHDRLLLVTDGIATAGAREAGPLAEALVATGVQRADALVVGGIRDEALLAELVTSELPNHGLVLDDATSASSVGLRLERATASGIGVRVPGAAWVWPHTMDGVQSGDEVLVYAAMESPSAPMEVWLDGAWVDQPVHFAEVERPLLERAAAKAHVDRLEAERALTEDPERRAALAAEIVDLSVGYRVLSSLTALLVLETEEDYVRYDIPRDALADILTVGPRGVEVIHREAPVLLPEDERPRQDREQRERAMKAKKADAVATRSDGPLAGDDFDADDRLAPPAPPPSVPEAEPDYASAPEPVAMEMDDEAPRVMMARERRSVLSGRGGGRREAAAEAAEEEEPRPQETDAWEGRFAVVMAAVRVGQAERAREEAWAWRHEDPADVLALVALGEAAEATGQPDLAARAYGSIIDLYPSRADMRRMAGERLERIHASALAADTYAVAASQRPDHPHGHRLLAWALARDGRFPEAVDALEAGLTRNYPGGRFAGWQQILSEDLGLVAAMWLAAEPSRARMIRGRLDHLGVQIPAEPSLRFVLMWETDANDVDFHIWDGKRGHAYYSSRDLPSGGSLYADVTTGYGPECFTIPGEPRAFPYTLQAHYYSKGPMGYGMGTLQVIQHDGQGGVELEDRPFVIMKDGAYVDLGTVAGPLSP